MRKVAAHRVKTPTGNIAQGLCEIAGCEVIAVRTLQGEEAMVEWMDGDIVCRKAEAGNILHAYYKEQILKE